MERKAAVKNCLMLRVEGDSAVRLGQRDRGDIVLAVHEKNHLFLLVQRPRQLDGPLRGAHRCFRRSGIGVIPIRSDKDIALLYLALPLLRDTQVHRRGLWIVHLILRCTGGKSRSQACG